MSNPLKKQRAVFPIEEYVSEEEEEMQDDFIGDVIDVDFDAFKAEDSDFHGIKRLLLPSLKGLDLDVSGIADTIISQNYIGSVVKQVIDEENADENDEDDHDQIFGVSTVINLTSRKDQEPITKLRSALVELCQEHGSDPTNQLVRESLGNESKHVGLLISERLVNLPPQFALPVFDSLIQEIEDANAKGMPYKFAYFVMICKIHKRTKRKLKAGVAQEEIQWSNPEEEIFFEQSLANFEYEIQGDTGLSGDWEEHDKQYTPFRRVLILKGDQLPSILTKVRQATS